MTLTWKAPYGLGAFFSTPSFYISTPPSLSLSLSLSLYLSFSLSLFLYYRTTFSLIFLSIYFLRPSPPHTYTLSRFCSLLSYHLFTYLSASILPFASSVPILLSLFNAPICFPTFLTLFLPVLLPLSPSPVPGPRPRLSAASAGCQPPPGPCPPGSWSTPPGCCSRCNVTTRTPFSPRLCAGR